MQIHFSCLLLLLSLSLSAQEPTPNETSGKGITSLSSPSADGGGQEGATYAVVVGISDYQDEGIPDLQYAHRDAEAFANFLRSPAGGGLDEDHLKVLLNEQATTAQFDAALGWLLDEAKEGDQVIIYFSGHGDVENRTRSQQGFLLCWDSPSRAYVAGAYPIFFLKEVIATLSLENKTRVQVITDACRAGKLAGNEIGGSQLTNQNLAQQYANEIKILSCQPDEYSLEGEQWGEGRGAFSYHLIDGLYGLADRNGDGTVNLMELRGYLEERVSEEVAPESQFPMTVGNSREELARVYPELLEKLKEGRRGQLQMFTGTESRGIVEEVLEAADSNVVEMYVAFQQAIADKQFLSPEDACADFYYEKLSREPQLARLHASMRRNYSAALQDDAQQALNTLLKSGLTEMILKGTSARKVYGNYPAYLDRAAALLGEGHYMYSILQARKNFFLGRIGGKRKNKRNYYRKALALQPDMGQAMVEMIRSSEANQLDSVKWYFEKVTQLAPSWVEPYIAMANYYQWRHKDLDASENMLDLAEKTDSNSLLVLYRKAHFYKNKRSNTKKAEQYFLKALSINTQNEICFPCLYNDLGHLYSSTGKYEKAIETFEKLATLDPSFDRSFLNLCFLYHQMKQWEVMEEPCLKCFELHGRESGSFLAEGYINLDRLDEAEELLEKVIEKDSTSIAPYALQVKLSYKQNNPARADSILKTITKIVDAMDPSKMNRFYVGSYFNAGQDLKEIGHFGEAINIYQKIIQLDSTYAAAYNNLGIIYKRTQNYAEAEKHFKKAIQLDSNYLNAYSGLGFVYLDTKRYEEAEWCFRKILSLDANHVNAYYNLACLSSKHGEWEEAFQLLEQALAKGYNDFDWIQKDSDLAPLREDTQRWQALMKKYFPEKWED